MIGELGVSDLYTITDASIRCANGTEFLFAGLQDHTVDSIKSFEGCDYAWVEEAHAISERSAEVLIPTIRKAGSEIWWTYNPTNSEDYVHKRFVLRGDPNALVVEINWRDNQWFPPELELERRELQRINDDLYQHVWEGKVRSAAGLMFKRDRFKFYDQKPEVLSNYMAADYAGAPDPDSGREPDYTEFGTGGLDSSGELYIHDWWSGQEDALVWIPAMGKMVRRNKPKYLFEEKGVILRSLDGSIAKYLKEHKDVHGRADPIYVCREALASASNKAHRALGFKAMVDSGSVWLPQNKPWAERLINQLCGFTGEAGRVDDGVDVVSLMARGLDVMRNARESKTEPKPEVKPFRRKWREQLPEGDAELERKRRSWYQ
jgi:predicted phage terminase large subunit-like protein